MTITAPRVAREQSPGCCGKAVRFGHVFAGVDDDASATARGCAQPHRDLPTIGWLADRVRNARQPSPAVTR